MKRLFLTRSTLLAVLAFAGAPPAHAQDLTVAIKNGTAEPLLGLYASPVELENWQDNLVAKPLPPGESVKAAIPDGRSTCRFDIRIELADTDPFVDDDVDLCTTDVYTVKDED